MIAAPASPADHHETPSTLSPHPGLLNTAIVDVRNGPLSRRVRLALDNGASISLMSESLASSLRFKRHPQKMELDGLMGGGRSRAYVQATLHSLYSNDFVTIKFGVVSRIPCATPPKRPDDILRDPCLKGKTPLADASLGGHPDALIGSLDVIQCIKGTPIYSRESAISATPTLFDWTIVAPLDSNQSQPVLKVQIRDDPLHESLQQLWELEKLPDEPIMLTEDIRALEHFEDTHSRHSDGRYIVKLPRKEHPPDLGSSRNMAVKRFLQNERSLKRKDKLSQFQDVLQEYISLDHSEPVPASEIQSPHYYLPVHGVIKEASTTTKLRAVFDASAHSSTGVSLMSVC